MTDIGWAGRCSAVAKWLSPSKNCAPRLGWGSLVGNILYLLSHIIAGRLRTVFKILPRSKEDTCTCVPDPLGTLPCVSLPLLILMCSLCYNKFLTISIMFLESSESRQWIMEFECGLGDLWCSNGRTFSIVERAGFCWVRDTCMRGHNTESSGLRGLNRRTGATFSKLA